MTVTVTTPPTIHLESAVPLWRTGLTAGVVAATATTAIAAVAGALGVSFESAPGEAIPLSGFAQLTLFFTAVGVVMARLIRNRSTHARSTFTTTAVALTLLSIVPDLVVSFDAASRVTLIVTHAVAAAIVIPALRRRLTDAPATAAIA